MQLNRVAKSKLFDTSSGIKRQTQNDEIVGKNIIGKVSISNNIKSFIWKTLKFKVEL